MKEIKKLVGKLEKWREPKYQTEIPSGTVSISGREIYLPFWTDEFIGAEEVDLYPDFDEEFVPVKTGHRGEFFQSRSQN